VVGILNGLGQAFRWTATGGMVGLGFLPGDTQAQWLGVSADGSVVVGDSINSAQPLSFHPFIWDAAHGMRSLQQVLTNDGLNLTGWTLVNAYEISADGSTIVGDGTDPGGKTEAWPAIIPEPGTGLLVLSSRRSHARAASTLRTESSLRESTQKR